LNKSTRIVIKFWPNTPALVWSDIYDGFTHAINREVHISPHFSSTPADCKVEYSLLPILSVVRYAIIADQLAAIKYVRRSFVLRPVWSDKLLVSLHWKWKTGDMMAGAVAVPGDWASDEKRLQSRNRHANIGAVRCRDTLHGGLRTSPDADCWDRQTWTPTLPPPQTSFPTISYFIHKWLAATAAWW